MRFLAIDTAHTHVEAALSCGGFFHDDNGRNASVALMPAVDELLRAAHLTLSDMDYFACVVGPGSFTGIRIGISTVRAFAYACRKPVLSLHALQCRAYNEKADGYARILSIADGSNGTAYTAEYDAQRREVVACTCVLESEALEYARGFDGAVCADAYFAAKDARFIAPDDRCRTLLRAAAALSSQAGDWQTLCPVYVRAAQAEADWEKKHRALS